MEKIYNLMNIIQILIETEKLLWVSKISDFVDNKQTSNNNMQAL